MEFVKVSNKDFCKFCLFSLLGRPLFFLQNKKFYTLEYKRAYCFLFVSQKSKKSRFVSVSAQK